MKIDFFDPIKNPITQDVILKNNSLCLEKKRSSQMDDVSVPIWERQGIQKA